MTLSIAVVCEAPADHRICCALSDRIVCHEIAWIEPEFLGHYRRWRGFRIKEDYLLWREVPRLAKSQRVSPHGHFDGEPGALEAGAVRKALLFLLASPDPPDAIMLLRDDDREAGRRDGFEQARAAVKVGIPVIVGLAHTKQECWVLAAFEPCDQAEREALDELRQELGFDPREKAEELTAKRESAKRSAKRVVAKLLGSNLDRKVECCRTAELDVMCRRGKKSGLDIFLTEIQERLVPLFAAHPRE